MLRKREKNTVGSHQVIGRPGGEVVAWVGVLDGMVGDAVAGGSCWKGRMRTRWRRGFGPSAALASLGKGAGPSRDAIGRRERRWVFVPGRMISTLAGRPIIGEAGGSPTPGQVVRRTTNRESLF